MAGIALAATPAMASILVASIAVRFPDGAMMETMRQRPAASGIAIAFILYLPALVGLKLLTDPGQDSLFVKRSERDFLTGLEKRPPGGK